MTTSVSSGTQVLPPTATAPTPAPADTSVVPGGPATDAAPSAGATSGAPTTGGGAPGMPAAVVTSPTLVDTALADVVGQATAVGKASGIVTEDPAYGIPAFVRQFLPGGDARRGSDQLGCCTPASGPAGGVAGGSRETYEVKRGDTLSKIAARFDTTWRELYRVNRSSIDDPNLIYPGQVLQLPKGGTPPVRVPVRPPSDPPTKGMSPTKPPTKGMPPVVPPPIGPKPATPPGPPPVQGPPVQVVPAPAKPRTAKPPTTMPTTPPPPVPDTSGTLPPAPPGA